MGYGPAHRRAGRRHRWGNDDRVHGCSPATGRPGPHHDGRARVVGSRVRHDRDRPGGAAAQRRPLLRHPHVRVGPARRAEEASTSSSRNNRYATTANDIFNAVFETRAPAGVTFERLDDQCEVVPDPPGSILRCSWADPIPLRPGDRSAGAVPPRRGDVPRRGELRAGDDGHRRRHVDEDDGSTKPSCRRRRTCGPSSSKRRTPTSWPAASRRDRALARPSDTRSGTTGPPRPASPRWRARSRRA